MSTTPVHNKYLSCIKDSETSEFTWHIWIQCNDNQEFYSPVFKKKCNYNVVTMWQLSNTMCARNTVKTSLISLNPFPVEVNFKLFISCDEVECLRDKQYRIRKFQSNDQQAESIQWSLDNWVPMRNSMSELLIITFTVNAHVSDLRSVVLPNIVDNKKKKTNFKKMLSDKCDIIFDIDGKELTAHKAILVTHSEVFQKMFSENWKELIDKKVKIETIKYEVFQELLYFIYSGELSDTETVFGIIDDLLMAADQYFINDLKDLCEIIMSHNLNIENGLKYLELADRCNANVLKFEAIQFIMENSDKFLETPEFKTFAESNGKLCFEIMNAFKKTLKMYKM